MKEIYIVVNNNDCNPKNKIDFAFLDKQGAEEYISNFTRFNTCHIETIYLYNDITLYGKCLLCGNQLI